LDDEREERICVMHDGWLDLRRLGVTNAPSRKVIKIGVKNGRRAVSVAVHD
jgi:hypothetical protein